MSDIDYKFNEGELIAEIKQYIDKTYQQHYAGGKIQATEDIIDDGHGTGFCIGNAKKYLKRYGKKGETPSEWRKDIIKVIHYGLIQLYVHDRDHGEAENPQMDLDIDWSAVRVAMPKSIDDATPEEWDRANRAVYEAVGDFFLEKSND